MVYLLKMVIFYSYVTNYQRVLHSFPYIYHLFRVQGFRPSRLEGLFFFLITTDGSNLVEIRQTNDMTNTKKI